MFVPVGWSAARGELDMRLGPAISVAAIVDQQLIPQLLFYKNIAVVGGLLTIAAWGAGAWSVDARRGKA